MRRREVFAIAVCALALHAPALHAAPPPDAAAIERARLAEEDARAAFDAGRYAEAAALFRAAYEVVPDPSTKYNEAFAWTKAGEVAPAADAYETALAFGELPDDLAAASNERLATLKARLGYLVVREPIGGRVTVAHAKDAPIPARIHLSPGTHEVTLHREDGTAATLVVEIAAAQTESLTFPADPPPAAPSPPPKMPTKTGPDEGDGSVLYPVLGWSLLGVAVAAGVATGIMGAKTLSTIDDFEATDRRDAGLRDDAVAFRTTTNVLLGVTTVAAVGGLAILWLAPSGDEASVAIGVAGPSAHLRASF